MVNDVGTRIITLEGCQNVYINFKNLWNTHRKLRGADEDGDELKNHGGFFFLRRGKLKRYKRSARLVLGVTICR